jgi:peptidoglycan hydrolase-like protein with peptidoglycan-binding domain
MPSLGMVINGRPDLPGPLAQLYLGRDGTFYVVAAGRAHHAGKGSWQGMNDGNSNFIGIEAENTGQTVGPQEDPWPPVQLDAYRRGVAALLRKIGASAAMCCGHKEYALPAGRKCDPTFDMDEFRQQVTAILNSSASNTTLLAPVNAGGMPMLRCGAKGDLVKQLQRKLRIRADGIFGPGTEAALRQFQRENGLLADGIVGPHTWAVLDVNWPNDGTC